MNWTYISTCPTKVVLGCVVCLAPLISSSTQDATSTLQASPSEASAQSAHGLFNRQAMIDCLAKDSGWVTKSSSSPSEGWAARALDATKTTETRDSCDQVQAVQVSETGKDSKGSFHLNKRPDSTKEQVRKVQTNRYEALQNKCEEEKSAAQREVERLQSAVGEGAEKKLEEATKKAGRNCDQVKNNIATKIQRFFLKGLIRKRNQEKSAEEIMILQQLAIEHHFELAELVKRQQRNAATSATTPSTTPVPCDDESPTSNCACEDVQKDGLAKFTRYSDPGKTVKERKSEFQLVMEHAGKPECIHPPAEDRQNTWEQHGWNKVTFDRNYKFYLKPEIILLSAEDWSKERTEMSQSKEQKKRPRAYDWSFETRWSRKGGDHDYKKGGYAIHPKNRIMRDLNCGGEFRLVQRTNAQWMNTKYVTTIADPNNLDHVGTRGNVFGAFGRLLVDTGFRAPLITTAELYDGLNAKFNIMPFRPLEGFFVKFPGGGLYSNFQFINQWSGSFGQEQEDTFEYVRNFVFNQQSQGSAFIEFHDFPHIFVPQSSRGQGRVLLASVEHQNGLAIEPQKFPTIVTNREAFVGRFQFMEVVIQYGEGLVCGGDCLHSDSATQGPILATVNPLDKSADTALLRERQTSDSALPLDPKDPILGTPFNPYTGIPETPWIKYECYPPSEEEEIKENEVLDAFGVEDKTEARMLLSKERFAEGAQLVI